MNEILAAWNHAEESVATETLMACCGAPRWAQAIVALRPFQTVESLSLTADEAWNTMKETDWLTAFACHPRIGDQVQGDACKPGRSATWSRNEQSSTTAADAKILAALVHGNEIYEQRFGFTYIVCATGKSAEEMLNILRRRLDNDRTRELGEAAEQQRLIMQIRLRKWLTE